jgi:starch phosphorylase
LIASGFFNPGEPGGFDPILETLLKKGDFYLHLADLRSYGDAHARLAQFYRSPDAWDRAAILNVPAQGGFRAAGPSRNMPARSGPLHLV